jgi:hypothetical protein
MTDEQLNALIRWAEVTKESASWSTSDEELLRALKQARTGRELGRGGDEPRDIVDFHL